MKLKLVYLGKIKEITGVSSELIEFSQSLTVESLIEKMTVQYPHLAFESFQISVNREIVSFSHKLTEDADVAFLPPFSGG